MATSGVPGAAYLAYSIHGSKGKAVYVALNPYEGPVPATLPDPPAGYTSLPHSSFPNE